MKTMETTTVTSVTEKYLMGSEELIASSPAFLATLQRDAIRNFMDKGFPTIRNEEWKYTNLASVIGRQYQQNPSGGKLTKEKVQQLSVLKNNPIVIVFENGKLNRELSSLANIPEGLIIDDLANQLNHPSVEKHLGKYADGKEESMVALNTVFSKQGCFIYVRKNLIIEAPVYILYINTADAALSYPRNLFIAEENTSINILESVHSLSEFTFTNAVTEIVLAKNAKLELTKAQVENAKAARVDHTEAVLEKNALFHIHTITVSDGLTRNDLHIVLNDHRPLRRPNFTRCDRSRTRPRLCGAERARRSDPRTGLGYHLRRSGQRRPLG